MTGNFTARLRAAPVERRWPTWLLWSLWFGVLVGTTLLLLVFRARLDKAHVTLACLLVVLGGSAAGGRRLGIALASLAFLTINFLFLPPYYSLVVADPLDWLILVAFLITGIVAAELLTRSELARVRAVEAEALRQTDALKTALIATVSHDLRTPLTTIKALAHRLAESGDEDALSIEEEADRLNRFVSDLLDLSRLSAGALPLRLEINAADELVATAMDRVRGTAGTRELRIVRDPAAPILFGTFDLVQSLRALVNLLDNALAHSPPTGTVELHVRRDLDRLRFTVADRGPGVPDADADRIFEPFFRPGVARPDAGRAGLGLTIARGIAEAQGGAVRYEPRTGGGSLFTLDLPAADPPPLDAD